MSKIIKEYQAFSGITTSNDPYPYVFEFIGEHGKYVMRVAQGNEDFIVEFPDGDISLSTSNLIKLAKREDSFFGQFEKGALLSFLQLHFIKNGAPSVQFEYVNEDEFYMLKLIPSKDLGVLTFPEKKRVWFRLATPENLQTAISDGTGKLYEWIVSRINDTSFYYDALCETRIDDYEGKECQRIGRNGVITSRLEINEGQYYQIACDKDKDIIVVYYPERCIPTTSDRFFEDVDGLIGTAKGKIESFYLDKLRESGFDMKTILASRHKAMDVIDAWRQK